MTTFATTLDTTLDATLDRQQVIAEISRLVGQCTDSPSVSADDNFFDLGLESLMLVEIKEAIFDQFSVTVKFSDFFTHFTVETLADLVVSRAGSVAGAGVSL